MDRDEKPPTTIDMTLPVRCQLAHAEILSRTDLASHLLDPELKVLFTARDALADPETDPDHLGAIDQRLMARREEIEAEVFARHGITAEEHETWFGNEIFKSIMGDAELWKRLTVGDGSN
jgi:hypothetical protein